ncbi:hypothetical protein SAMN05518849_11658 [Sphingobium sp. AP50]|nr:hypothetical protein SAMN05518849_11658 [Sphingobium sp. AP50]
MEWVNIGWAALFLFVMISVPVYWVVKLGTYSRGRAAKVSAAVTLICFAMASCQAYFGFPDRDQEPVPHQPAYER